MPSHETMTAIRDSNLDNTQTVAAVRFLGRLLRSITPITGALICGSAVAVPMVGTLVYDVKFGHPTSTSGLVIPFAFIFGACGAAVGAFLGLVAREVVDRKGWAGPPDRRLVAIIMLLAIGIPTAVGAQSVRRREAAHAPRVVRTTAELERGDGVSDLVPRQSATFLWDSWPRPDRPVQPLQWNGRLVTVTAADRLRVHTDGRLVAEIDIGRYPYANAIYGVTARLRGESAEWLALLLQLRWNSERDLFVILDPQGSIVHEEVLERNYRTRLPPRVGLETAGSPDAPQEFVVDRGDPIRFRSK